MKEERVKEERLSRHADEIPTNFNLCEKKQQRSAVF